MGVTNECIPYQEPGQRLPCSVRAGKAVLGKRFVKIGADMQGDPNALSNDVEGNNYIIEPAAAGERALGVASHNAAEKKKVTVLAGDYVIPVTAGGAIAANDPVAVGAEGKAVKAEGAAVVVGIALADTANGVDCPVKQII
jgi:hypothetical protein